jgi:DNA-binding transcriptional LysR family regulator
MRGTHTFLLLLRAWHEHPVSLRIISVNTDLLKSFAAIAESGSLSKTAERMRVSQSTLTRQVQALEQEIGGRVFERSHSGVALTTAGQALFTAIRPLLAGFEAAIGEARKLARGQSGSLRIGYLMSAATEYLNPALAEVSAIHPEVKVKLVDMSPGEQIAALRRGDLDVALVGNADASLAREFYVKRLATLPVVVALPQRHPLARRDVLHLDDLRNEAFIGAREEDLPGHRAWLVQLCRRARFRPKIVEESEGLTHALSLLVAENAVVLLPGMENMFRAPGVVYRPLEERAARWDLLVAWQRGQITAPVKALVNALSRTARQPRDKAR